VEASRQRERVVVIDPANTFMYRRCEIRGAKDLTRNKASCGDRLFGMQSKGFDNEPLLKQIFLKRAMEKATAYR